MRLQGTPRLETLEQRRLLSASLEQGVLVIVGTDGDDELIVEANADSIHVSVNGVQSTFDRALVATIQMTGLDGNDLLGVWVDETFDVPVYADGGAGNDTIEGAAGNDTLIGGDGNDSIYAYAGDDDISGGAGVDYILGGAGNDSLLGGDDDDQLFGQGGNDDLDGGLGADLLDGGEDADLFVNPDNTDTMINDGLDSIWVSPPPPEEPVSDKHPNWKRGHCNKPDHALGAGSAAQSSHGEITRTDAPGRSKR